VGVAELFTGGNSSLATNVHLAHLFLLHKNAAFMLRGSLSLGPSPPFIRGGVSEKVSTKGGLVWRVAPPLHIANAGNGGRAAVL
jgi:hypothetical protein